jgi:hypothetical protein
VRPALASAPRRLGSGALEAAGYGDLVAQLPERPYSQTVEYDCAIAFDARTREPHIVRAHHDQSTAEEPGASPSKPLGALRSLFRKLTKGDKRIS